MDLRGKRRKRLRRFHPTAAGCIPRLAWRHLAQQRGSRTKREQTLALYTLFDLPHINQVYMLFRAELADLDFAPGEESLDVRLFHEREVPWSDLAFPTIGRTLECFFADRQHADFPVRNEPIAPLLAYLQKHHRISS